MLPKTGYSNLTYSAITRNIPLSSRSVSLVEVKEKPKYILDAPKKYLTSNSRRLFATSLWQPFAVSGIGVPFQIRLAHTDVTRVPYFSEYRYNNEVDKKTNESDYSHRFAGYTR